MTEYALRWAGLGRRESAKGNPEKGSVRPDRLAVFDSLKGRTVHCTSGYLWLTLGSEGMDRVVRAGQSVVIPTGGKAIVGGKGDYAIEKGTSRS